MLPHLRIQLFQSLHQLLLQEWTEVQQTLMCGYSVCSSLLVSPMTIDEFALSIDLKTPEDVFRPRYSSKVRRIPLVTHVYPAMVSCSSHATLCTCSSSSVTAYAASTAVWRRWRLFAFTSSSALRLSLGWEEDAA